MPKQTSTVQEIFVEELKDIYSAETQITKALPKMAKAATDPDLKKGFLLHLEQTKVHAERVKLICESLKEKPTGKPPLSESFYRDNLLFCAAKLDKAGQRL